MFVFPPNMRGKTKRGERKKKKKKRGEFV